MSPFYPEQPENPRLPSRRSFPKRNQVIEPRQLIRYQVILLGDPQLDLMLVVRSVMELTRFPRAEATHKMWQAHHSGRSVVLTTHLERAELYAEQFADRGIRVKLEAIR